VIATDASHRQFLTWRSGEKVGFMTISIRDPLKTAYYSKSGDSYRREGFLNISMSEIRETHLEGQVTNLAAHAGSKSDDLPLYNPALPEYTEELSKVGRVIYLDSGGEHTAALATLKGHDLFDQTVALFRNDGHLYRDCGNLTIAFTRSAAAARAAELNQLPQDCAQRNAAQ
jgi:hypothetical protein